MLRHQPDLVLVGYALNDACGGEANLPNYNHAMAEIVGRVKRGTKGDAVLLTPNFMNTRDNNLVAASTARAASSSGSWKSRAAGCSAATSRRSASWAPG